MELIKLIAAGGVGGATFATGSLLSGKGIQNLSGPAYSSNVYDEPPVSPFRDFDLDCIEQKSWWNGGTVFENKFSNYSKAREEITRTLGPIKPTPFNLPAPSTTAETGAVRGCFKTTFDRIEGEDKKIMGVRMEMAIAKGKHGLVLMNHIANIKDYGARMNSLRAIFLERDEYWWKIKGGIQWSDEEFLKATKNAKKLTWDGLKKKEEIHWEYYTAFEEIKKESFSRSWKSDDNGKPLYQQLTITADPTSESKAQDFWNGQLEPLSANSNYQKPYAVFGDNDAWEITPEKTDVTKAKQWFNLFKDLKGSWE